MLNVGQEFKETRRKKYLYLLKNKWRENLKAKNAYKRVILTSEKVLGNRMYKSKISGFEALRALYLKSADNTKSTKQIQLKEELLVCDREVELAGLNATDSKLAHLKSALFNNPELFNWLFKDE